MSDSAVMSAIDAAYRADMERLEKSILDDLASLREEGKKIEALERSLQGTDMSGAGGRPTTVPPPDSFSNATHSVKATNEMIRQVAQGNTEKKQRMQRGDDPGDDWSSGKPSEDSAIAGMMEDPEIAAMMEKARVVRGKAYASLMQDQPSQQDGPATGDKERPAVAAGAMGVGGQEKGDLKRGAEPTQSKDPAAPSPMEVEDMQDKAEAMKLDNPLLRPGWSKQKEGTGEKYKQSYWGVEKMFLPLEPKTKFMPNYKSKWADFNVERAIAKAEGRKLAMTQTNGVRGMPLVPPAVSPNKKMVAVANSDPRPKAWGAEHWIAVFDVEKLSINKAEPEKALVAMLDFHQQFRYICWVTDDILVAGGGAKGEVFYFRLQTKDTDQSKILKHVGGVDRHKGEIREIVRCSTDPRCLASASLDKSVVIWDISDTQQGLRLDVKSTVSSLQWDQHDGQGAYNNELTMTTDDGHFMLLDVRTDPSQAMLSFERRQHSSIHLPTVFLWGHMRYSKNHVMLGLGDGRFQHFDFRKLEEPIEEMRDRFCNGIGCIDFNDEKAAFVVSGYTDFTVWRNNTTWGETNVWSHSVAAGRIKRPGNYSVHAKWLDSDTVVATTSDGNMSFFTQGFDDYVTFDMDGLYGQRKDNSDDERL